MVGIAATYVRTLDSDNGTECFLPVGAAQHRTPDLAVGSRTTEVWSQLPMLVANTCARIDLPAVQEVRKTTTQLLPNLEALGL